MQNINNHEKLNLYLNSLGIKTENLSNEKTQELSLQTSIVNNEPISQNDFNNAVCEVFDIELNNIDDEYQKTLDEAWNNLSLADNEEGFSAIDYYSQINLSDIDDIRKEYKENSLDSFDSVEFDETITKDELESLKYQNILALALEAVPEFDNSEIEKNISQLNDYKENFSNLLKQVIQNVSDTDKAELEDYFGQYGSVTENLLIINQNIELINNLSNSVINLIDEISETEDEERKKELNKILDDTNEKIIENLAEIEKANEELKSFSDNQKDFESELCQLLDSLQSQSNADFTQVSEYIDKINEMLAQIDENDTLFNFDKISTLIHNINQCNEKFADIDDSDDTDETTEENSETNSTAQIATPSASAGNGGGSVNSSNSSNSSTVNNDGSNDIESKDDIKKELNDNKKDYSSKKANFNNALDDKTTKLKDLKAKSDKAYTAFYDDLSTVDPALAADLSSLKEKIDAKEEEYYKSQGVLSKNECQLIQLKEQYSLADDRVVALEERLKVLSEDGSSEAKKLIPNLKKEIEKAKSERDELKEEYKELNGSIDGLREDTNNLKTSDDGLDELNSELDGLILKITNSYPNLNTKAKEFSDSYDNWQTTKEKEVNTSKTALIDSQEDLVKTESELYKLETQELINKYSPNTMGEKLIEFGEQFIGYNGNDGSADIFWKGLGKSCSANEKAWCHAFVLYVLKKTGQYENMPEWYQKHHNSSHNVYETAKKEGAIIKPTEAKAGDIVVFDWEANKEHIDHIGFIKEVKNGKIVTLEGNNGNKVCEVTYDINDKRLFICKTTS